MKTRKPQQGFTLVEIAVVLVIIGLLLGGVLKGQELINSAKAKSLVQEFNSVSVMMYGYQDRFRALPGDDANAKAHVDGTPPSGDNAGNGRIDGKWNSTDSTDESYLFWEHVRLAGLATGSTTVGAPNYLPTNAENGRLGVTSTTPIAGWPGQFFVCSGGLSGRFARQLDSTMDDGVTDTGSVRTLNEVGTAVNLTASSPDAGLYTVCAAY